MVEGEGCADALCAIGLCATTTLGGSSKYHSYGNYKEDLAGATLILCPDRDKPGLKHMEAITADYPPEPVPVPLPVRLPILPGALLLLLTALSLSDKAVLFVAIP